MKHKIEIEVEIPDYWMDFITHDHLIFSGNYCGYWMRRVIGTMDGHVVRELDADPEITTPLPKGYFHLTREVALKAFGEGVKRWGADWIKGPHGDANGYDVALQLALFGEIKYG